MAMPYVEMTIDSIRHAKYRDEWVILLKEKDGQRSLPVYVDKLSAGMARKALKGEKCDQLVDDKLKQMLAMDDEVALVIDGIDQGIFNAECIMGWRGRPSAVKCSIGEVLVLCAKASGRIVVEESVLGEAGIATKS